MYLENRIQVHRKYKNTIIRILYDYDYFYHDHRYYEQINSPYINNISRLINVYDVFLCCR